MIKQFSSTGMNTARQKLDCLPDLQLGSGRP